jgi:hypothetical protein
MFFRVNRRGQSCGPSWVASMAPCVVAWGQFDIEQFQHIGQHIDDSCAYLWWFRPRTRIRVMFVAMDLYLHVPTMQDLFLHHPVEGIVNL